MEAKARQSEGRRRVLFALYAHPAAFPPVERAAQILRESGWRVRVIGAAGLETDALAGRNLEGLEVRLVSRAGQGLRQKLQYARFLAVCALHLIRWRPRWVYVSDTFATPFGLLASVAGFRVLYHEHDAPIDEAHSAFVRAILSARRALLRRATVVVTPNASRSAAASREGGGRPVVTAWNCPRLTEIPSRAAARREHTPLRIVYHGSIGRDRPPFAIVDAIARVGGDAELEIAGYETVGSRGQVAETIRRAEALGIATRVMTSGPMPRAELLERAAAGHLGLAFMPTVDPNFNERTMAGASNKAFEYLACGVPLLVSDLPDWRELFVDRGVAFAADPGDVDGLARVLRHAMEHRAELEAMGERGRRLVSAEWNYEIQFRPVLDAMARSDPGIGLAQP